MWFVSWDVIYHRRTSSKTRFSPLFLLQEATFTLEPILFSTCVTAWTTFVFMNYCLINIGQQFTNTVFITLFVECFFVIFKNMTHTIFEEKHPCKVGRNVYMGKNVPPKWDPGLMKVQSLLGGKIYFHIFVFWFCNTILF